MKLKECHIDLFPLLLNFHEIYATTAVGPLPRLPSDVSTVQQTRIYRNFCVPVSRNGPLKERSQRFGSVMFLISVPSKDEQLNLH